MRAAILAAVISGGQSGVDRAGLRAARRAGLPTGGTAPSGYLTEHGPRPGLGRRYGLLAHPSGGYRTRTRANVQDSDLTLIIARSLDRGSGLTATFCERLGRPFLCLAGTRIAAHREALAWLLAERQRIGRPLILNVAGNRESRDPGIGRRADRFLGRLFATLREIEEPR